MTPIRFLSPQIEWARRRINDIQTTLAVAQNGSLPRRADWVLAVLFAVLGIIESVEDNAPGFGWEITALLIACAGVPHRRVRPPVALALSMFVFFVGSAIERNDEMGVTGGLFLAMIWLTYGLCRWRPAREIYLGLGALVVLEPLAAGVRTGSLGEVIGSLTLWVAIIGVAALMRSRRVLQLNQIEQARLSERNVLARELHDSVAHYVSAIAVQAQAAQYIAKSDPVAAVNAMAEVEQTANRAIDEMRRMVGVLRTSDDIARTVASDSLLDLVDPNMTPPVNITGVSDLGMLGPSVAAATYRVAQESVTNARKHAPRGTFVNLQCEITDDEVILQIVNDGFTGGNTGGGYGLVGMEERVQLLGGSIAAGPAPGNLWSVVARIPHRRSTGEDE